MSMRKSPFHTLDTGPEDDAEFQCQVMGDGSAQRSRAAQLSVLSPPGQPVILTPQV